MSQYVVDVNESKQAGALIRYLKTLDFVEVKSIKQDRKIRASTDAKAFLKGLPDQSVKQSEVNQAVSDIRW